jgi:hypoxanthine-DNA glycosylase
VKPQEHHRVESFPPQVAPGCVLLILGTVPSVRSLELRQSYGHQYNLFWPFMGELFDAGPELAYAERIARLQRRGIGIWDVLERCERRGSLDSAIVPDSEVANDIPGLLSTHPGIRAIALNGGRAQQSFRRHIVPRLDRATRARITQLDLPSTSPANASIPRARKLERWRQLLDWTSTQPTTRQR